MGSESLGRVGRNARNENREMTESEKQALKQVQAWIDRLELNGQALNDNAYFGLSGDLQSVFGAVALLHGLTTQQVLDLIAVEK